MKVLTKLESKVNIHQIMEQESDKPEMNRSIATKEDVGLGHIYFMT